MRRLPALSDGRVLLRAAETRDVGAFDAGMHDPDVIRWIGPPELSAAEAIERDRRRWKDGSPTFAICRVDDTCVGKVWLGIEGVEPRTGSVGYWLLPEARGRGLASSAVRLISTWAARELGIERFRLTTARDNERSQRLAERLGFHRAATSNDDPDNVTFELDRDALLRGRLGGMTNSILAHGFAHHAWANERIFEACASLGSAELMAPVPGAYGPIIAILHHLVDADAFYLRVLTGRDDFVYIDEHSRFGVDELSAFSKQHEAAYAAFLPTATDPDADVVEHGDDFEFHAPLGVRLAQVLHHGTDHRSQVCTALTGLGITPPLIDLWDYAEAKGLSYSTGKAAAG